MLALREDWRRLQHGMQVRRLRDRADAGRQLAQKLLRYADRSDVLVLGLPRGGVPVAYEIAKALRGPLDVFVVRKLGVPGYEELAMGALASGGIRVLNEDVVRGLALADDVIEAVTTREQLELERRERAYRGNRPRLDVRGKTVIVVDDGIATGATLRAALAALRVQAPARLIVAVGVAPSETCATLEAEVDELVCLIRVDAFGAVGRWFVDFAPTVDTEVRDLLAQAVALPTTKPDPASEAFPVQIPLGQVMLHGDLSIPDNAKGLVLFAHGSGSSRLSPRNRFVAQALQADGLATLLFDLLTTAEEAVDLRTRHLRFAVDLLANRLVAVTDWALQQPPLQALPLGYFGASTGAAAALLAAVQRPDAVTAIVARGGRPDLAQAALPQVQVPTLLIVGSADVPVMQMNEQALAALHAEAQLVSVPGATHLFAEPGALEQVAHLASTWFQRHFAAVPQQKAEKLARLL